MLAPVVAAELGGHLQHHEPVAQVVNRLSPRKLSSLAMIASMASAAAWWARSSSSGPVIPAPSRRRRLAAATADQQAMQTAAGPPRAPGPCR